MLTITLNQSKSIITVIETIMTFNETLTSYWYYDIINWRKSITGKKDAPFAVDIEPWQKEWIKKHYFKKVNLG